MVTDYACKANYTCNISHVNFDFSDAFPFVGTVTLTETVMMDQMKSNQNVVSSTENLLLLAFLSKF